MFDEVDMMIISALQQNGKLSTRDLSKIIGLSHTAIRKRLTRLPIKITALLSRDIVKGLVLVRGKLRNNNDINTILQKFEKCPRMLILSSLRSDEYIALMFAEDYSVIDCISLDCAIRMIPEAEKVEALIIDRVLVPDYLYIKIPLNRSEIAPCGRNCAHCMRFKNGQCPGCPAVRYYRGPLMSRR